MFFKYAFLYLQECADKIGEGEKKLKATKDLCEKTTKNSSQRGREVLRRDIDHLQSEWEDYLARIQQTEEDLQTALVQWGDFESKFAVCSSWLKDMEQQVKNYELKSSLKEKQAQVERFKVKRYITTLTCRTFNFSCLCSSHKSIYKENLKESP